MTVKESFWEQIKDDTCGEFAMLSPEDFFEAPSECYYLAGKGIGSGEHCFAVAEDLFTTMLHQRHYPKFIVLMDEAVGLLRKGEPLASVFAEMEKNGSTVCASAKSIALYGWENEIDPDFAESTATILDVLRVSDKVISL
ncbi:MAG: hypothetical protein IJC82_05620 [Firmicutes bacterium]|nr:hypothetical protein [Bacillota bacterium]